MRSSWIWNAMPVFWPNGIERLHLPLVPACEGAADGCGCRVEDTGLHPTIFMYSSSVTSARCSKDISMCWPSQMSAQARARSAVARTFACPHRPSPAR